MADDDLQSKTVAELQDQARLAEIEGRSSMDRDELVKALRKAGKAGKKARVTTPVQYQDT
jgi:hypothetical protein